MKNLKRSILTTLIVLILIASSFVFSYAAESSQPASYSKKYNSGQREVVCTTLDGTSASSYYTGSYTYDNLSTLSPSSLYSSLQTLMRSTHNYTSSYDDCHYMADRTDCQNGDGSVSLIYTSYSATMSQWNGWNREHVWPKSLGGDSTTGGGADLHHIRPADAVVNSTRSNKLYGNANGGTAVYGRTPASGCLGGYYSGNYFEPLDDVKGDVARICLYVYVRWGTDWGASDITDVFQSVDVLLEWCESDPVDTWEMGRNEVVEDIQGNRNVFIDYPELAWILFEEEVPSDMTTPSGEAMGGSTSSGGSSSGGSSSSGDSSDNTGTDTDTGSGSTGDSTTDSNAGEATISFATTDQRTSLSTSQQIWENGGVTFTNNKASSNNDVADYSNPVRLYANSSITINAPGNITKIEAACDSSSYATTLKTSVGDEATASGSTVTIIPTTQSQTYTINSLSAPVRLDSITVTYETASCEHTNTTTTTVDATCSAAGSTTETCDDCGETISVTSIPKLEHTNTTTTTVDATCSAAGSTTVTCTDCGGVVSVTNISALGHSYVDDVCSVCGEALPKYACSFIGPENTRSFEVSGNSVTMPAPTALSGVYKYNYVFVGWAKDTATDTTTAPELFAEGDIVTIDEDTTFYAVYSYSAEGEGATSYVKKDISEIGATDVVVITMANGSTVYALTSGNGASAAPTATTVTISGDALTTAPADNLKWNISNSSGTLTIYPDGTTATWLYCTNNNNGVRVGTGDASTFKIEETYGYLYNIDQSRYIGVYNGADWRCYSPEPTGNSNIAGQTLAFYVESATTESVTHYTTILTVADGSSTCEHTNTTLTTTDATCTAVGSTTVTCNDCGATVSETEIPAKGHTEVTDAAVAPTCTATGLTEGKHCSVCNEVITAQKTVDALGHSYTDGTCSVCGEIKPTDKLGLSGKRFYIATIRSSGNYFYMTCDLGTSSTKRYQAVDSGLTALPTSIDSTAAESTYIFEFVYNEDGTYSIFAADVSGDNYLGHSSDNSGILVAKDSALKLTVDCTDGVYNIHYTASDAERYLALNNTSGNNYFAFYKSGQKQDLSLIPVASPCEHTNTATTTTNATCTTAGATVVTCTDCGEIVSAKETDAALGHDFVDGICARCGSTESSSTPEPTESGWVLVTDVSSLNAGDKIVIVAKDYNYALSTTQNNNNRGQAAVTKSDDTVTFGDDVQILTLEAGTVDGSFAFNTGSGYLYAASSSKNYLRTETSLSANSSWKITIDAGGTASVVAQGTNTRNFMQYNVNDTLFACYSSASQKPITIYKYVEASSGSEGIKIAGASMTVGTTLAMNYYVSGHTGTDYYMVFTMNGVVSDNIVGEEKDGYLVFSFKYIPPQFMGDNISATLYTSDGTALATLAEYSIKTYATNVMNAHSDNQALMNLVADMLRYGAAAQQYRGYKTDSLVTDGLDLPKDFGSNATVTEDDNQRSLVTEEGTDIDSDVYSITAMGVRFDFDNKIYVKFRADDLENVKVTINGVDVTEGAELTNDGIYVIYSDGISATQFDKIYTIKLYVGEKLHQTVTYSVNSYSYAKQDSNTTGLAALVDALYNYGKSAQAYKSKEA